MLDVAPGAGVVECQLDSKSNTVTFKFDVADANPEEIASNLVSARYSFHLEEVVH